MSGRPYDDRRGHEGDQGGSQYDYRRSYDQRSPASGAPPYEDRGFDGRNGYNGGDGYQRHTPSHHDRPPASSDRGFERGSPPSTAPPRGFERRASRFDRPPPGHYERPYERQGPSTPRFERHDRGFEQQNTPGHYRDSNPDRHDGRPPQMGNYADPPAQGGFGERPPQSHYTQQPPAHSHYDRQPPFYGDRGERGPPTPSEPRGGYDEGRHRGYDRGFDGGHGEPRTPQYQQGFGHDDRARSEHRFPSTTPRERFRDTAPEPMDITPATNTAAAPPLSVNIPHVSSGASMLSPPMHGRAPQSAPPLSRQGSGPTNTTPFRSSAGSSPMVGAYDGRNTPRSARGPGEPSVTPRAGAGAAGQFGDSDPAAVQSRDVAPAGSSEAERTFWQHKEQARLIADARQAIDERVHKTRLAYETKARAVENIDIRLRELELTIQTLQAETAL